MIPTKNRPAALRHTLGTVLAQRQPVDQIIIVDQSAAGAREVVGRLRAVGANAPDWVYLHAPQISGGAAARNRAMDLAWGTIWLFLDDDVELGADFTAALLAAYRDRPDAVGMAGLITNYQRPCWRERGWNAVFRRGIFRDDRQPLYWNAARLRGREPLPVSRFTGCAMSFRAAAVGQLRFDERLTGVSNGEDVSFCLALTGGGPGLFVAPGARLRHLRDPAGRSHAHWTEQTARDAWFLYLGRHIRPVRRAGLERWRLAWLDFGLGLAATASALHHRSRFLLGAPRVGRREALAIAAHPPGDLAPRPGGSTEACAIGYAAGNSRGAHIGEHPALADVQRSWPIHDQ